MASWTAVREERDDGLEGDAGDSPGEESIMSAQISAVLRDTLVPVRSVHVVHGDGQVEDLRTVRCLPHDRAMTLDQCLSCAESGGLAEASAEHPRIEYATCRHAGAGTEARRTEAHTAIADVKVGDVMTTDVLAVRPDVSLEALAGLFLERGIGGAPVMGEGGRPIGIVSTTDLIVERQVAGDTGEETTKGWQAPRGARRVEIGPGVHVEVSPDRSVADVMTRAALSLPESAPLAQAAALMASRGIHRVIVVSEDGALAGIVTTTDVARWVAQQGGFLRPEA